MRRNLNRQELVHHNSDTVAKQRIDQGECCTSECGLLVALLRLSTAVACRQRSYKVMASFLACFCPCLTSTGINILNGAGVSYL